MVCMLICLASILFVRLNPLFNLFFPRFNISRLLRREKKYLVKAQRAKKKYDAEFARWQKWQRKEESEKSRRANKPQKISLLTGKAVKETASEKRKRQKNGTANKKGSKRQRSTSGKKSDKSGSASGDMRLPTDSVMSKRKYNKFLRLAKNPKPSYKPLSLETQDFVAGILEGVMPIALHSKKSRREKAVLQKHMNAAMARVKERLSSLLAPAPLHSGKGTRAKVIGSFSSSFLNRNKQLEEDLKEQSI